MAVNMKNIKRLARHAFPERFKASLYKFLSIIKVVSNPFLDHENAIAKEYGSPDQFCVGRISDELNCSLIKYIQKAQCLKSFYLEPSDNPVPSYSSLIQSFYSDETAQLLCAKVIKKAYNLDPEHLAVKELHCQLRKIFREYIKSPFAIVNSRAWSTYPSSVEFGPTAPHKDGFEPGHLKIMVYPEGLCEDAGYLVLADQKLINFSPGTCIAFLNSDVLHNAVPGKSRDRLCVEITIQRTFIDIDQFTLSSFNGLHFSHPLHAYYYSESKSKLLPVAQTRLINIGSGVRDWKHWLLLDEIPHVNVYPFKSSPTCCIPAYSDSADIIYSSHHIEHIDGKSMERLLIESFRVLRSNGYFILKYPDYDLFLQQYRSGVLDFMNNKGIESVLWSWRNASVLDNLENRLAMMFVGYWNNFYGDHFTGKIRYSSKAYHGPPVVERSKLRELFWSASISEICAYLRMAAMSDTSFKAFNHQSAWSNFELIRLVSSFGFKHLPFSKAHIKNQFLPLVPDLGSMEDWSAFQIFTK